MRWSAHRSAALLGAALVASVASPPDATACGGFFRAKGPGPLPSLSVERVLLAYDRAKETEHFVREVVFHRAHEPFGFVVPTPTKPEVAKVAEPLFSRLERSFPYPDFSSLGTLGGGQGFGTGRGRLGGVEVLSQQRVGSFTAFVLAATDPKILAKWLDENKLKTTPETEAWLAHYVKLRFYYVAFRYEPSEAKGDEKRLVSETVRISFSTPVPYYPYFEPDRDDALPERVLALWLVSRDPMVPVAARRESNGSIHWKQPLRAGRRFLSVGDTRVREAVGEKLAALLPEGAVSNDPLRDLAPGERLLTVQTFEDQKTSRKGWGDVLFVPEKPEEVDAATAARRRALLALLDPALEGAP
jgi:hypothetical protein